MELQNCMTDMLSTLASGFGDKALMLVDKDGTPAGHILGTEMVGAMEYEKYRRKFNHLPTGFVELEYLESTGTQYIDTGYKRTAGSTYKMVVDMLPSVYTGAQFFFTLGEDWPAYYVGLYGGKVALYDNSTLPNSIGRHVYTLSLNEANTTGTLTDGTESTSYTRSSANYTGKALLFARQTNANFSRCKIYFAKIFKNDAIQMELVPAMHSSDGEVGMFDLITGAFLTNAGTGEFEFKIKEFPQGYTQLAYIGSNGTQKIETGIVSTSTKEFGCDFIYSNYVQWGNIWGDYVAQEVNATRLILANWEGGGFANFMTKGGGGGKSFACSKNVRHYVIVSATGVVSDGGKVVNSWDTPGTDNSNPISLFGIGTDVGAKIYSFIARDNGSIIMRLIPAKRNSDNVVGMYDLVSNTFLTNAGTGTFSYGEL